MATNQQRREAERRRLQRQLEERRAREAARKRTTLIASIIGTLVVIALVIVIVLVSTGGSDNKNKPAAGGQDTVSSPPTSTAPASRCPTGSAPRRVATGSGPAVSFQGVTVKGATNMSKPPSVGSSATEPPAKLLVKDLVVGKGTVATPQSTVSVKYTGVLYCDGTEFDGPAEHGDKAISFSLQQVVPGFTQGIGGTTGIAPMHVGGRRIIIMPAALGYGSQANQAIPANAPLVFVVDLTKVSG